MWLTNPRPRNSFEGRSSPRGAGRGDGHLPRVYATAVGFSVHADVALLVADLSVPIRFVPAGVVSSCHRAAAYAEGEYWGRFGYLAPPHRFRGMARWGMERAARERLRRQDAIQRAKPSGRA